MSSADELLLRPATESDAPDLAALVKAAYGHYVERMGAEPRPMTDDYLEVVRAKRVTVAERGGALAGFVALDVDEEGFCVDNVAVHPASQGTGVGRALLVHAEDEARAAGFSEIHLYTHESMAENQALYARIGYVEYGRRPIGPGGTAVVFMRKSLA